jgi:hypothetical protein
MALDTGAVVTRLPVLAAASLALALASAAWLAPDGHCDTPAAMPHPAPQSARDANAENSRCETCHAEIAGEWRASMHARADTDPVYRRALALEPLAFCRACHAPEADPGADAPAILSALGVACVTCHVTAAGQNAPTLAGTAGGGVAAPHAVLRAQGFATAAACASCHEFDFPTHAPGQRPDRMQSTVSEHATSAYADASCASCHMPLTVSAAASGGRKHRSHLFAASHDAAQLSAAVTVGARRTSALGITLTLAPGQVGHAFPTGDLFRRLVVTAEAVGDDWIVLGEASRALHRRFELREIAPGQTGRHVVGDDRVGVGRPQPLTFDLGEVARGRAIAWRVEYQRVEHPVGTDDSRAVVAASIVVAEGLVPATVSGP